MKKFLTSFAIAALCALSANAQDTTSPTTNTSANTSNAPTAQNTKPQTAKMMRDFRKDRQAQKTTDSDDKYANAQEMREFNEKRRFRGMDMTNNQPQENNAINEKYRTASLEEKNSNDQNKKFGGMNSSNEMSEGMPPEGRPNMPPREVMEKLTSEQKAAVKNEMERHRAEMKKITGFDPR